MNSYILNLTFYAGSNDEEDTDRGIYMIESKNPISEQELTDIIDTANSRCNCFDDEKEENFPSYEVGLNINTLVEGIAEIIKDYATIKPLSERAIVYNIEQCQ